MKVLLVDESESRARRLQQQLTLRGCAVFIHLGWTSVSLMGLIGTYDPDVILLDARCPRRAHLPDLLDVASLKPVAIFAEQAEAHTAQEMIEAGAHAYVVGDPEHLDANALVEAAMAQFRRIQRLKQELDQSQSRLRERKLIDRAKGILMKSRGFDEDTAYHALRKMAMEKKVRLGEIAEQVVHMAELLQ